MLSMKNDPRFCRYLLTSGILILSSCALNLLIVGVPVQGAVVYPLSAGVAIVGFILTLLHQWRPAKIAIGIGIALLLVAVLYSSIGPHLRSY